jgi:ribokinase
MDKVDVFGFGHCCIDYLTVLDPFPEKGKKGDVVESLVIGGGPVPTAIMTTVRFGLKAGFCGKVGADNDGRIVIEGLKAGGVDVSSMIIDENARTARAYIWIDPHDGSRTVALDRTRFAWLTAAELNLDLVRNCRVFLCDGRAVEACLDGLKVARECGVTTVFDAGAARPRIEEMMTMVDYAIVSADLADTAIITNGAEGAVWCRGEKSARVAGFRTKVYDTTGAGDVFHGAFIYGILKGFNLEPAIRFANAAAALACRKLSGQGSIPHLSEVEKLISR